MPSEEPQESSNQVPPLEEWNPFLRDAALQEAVDREGAGWAREAIVRHAAQAGSAEVVGWGFLANESPPRLHTHDRFGRIDEVRFHPAWHSLLRWSMGNEVHSLAYTEKRPGAWVARAALFMLSAGVEAGHVCPVSMATACVPALRTTPALAEVWVPRVNATRYDPRFVAPEEKSACLIGVAMTEKQGGSDVRSNTTRAVPLGARGPGELYALTGHKWFLSAPMCDAFLTLAQTGGDAGPSCFLLPRILGGRKNGLSIVRMKDKLGNRANASVEVEYHGAHAWLVGEEGRGLPAILEMVNNTRLDCTLISTALMRLALAHAVHHARRRSAFGKKLVDHALMANVLADLALESEAATALSMRIAGAYDREAAHPAERHLRRLATAAGKYWICKRAAVQIGEAMECLGGDGFTEEVILPRLYREAPLNSMWEGSGNVICLDVQRALRNQPETADALLGELRSAAGGDRRLDAATRALEADLREGRREQGDGRRLAERIAVTLQASLLVRHAPAPVADAFCASRLAGEGGVCFGTLPCTLDHRFIIDRALSG